MLKYLLTSAALAVGLAATAGGAHAADKLTFALVPKNTNNPFFDQAQAGVPGHLDDLRHRVGTVLAVQQQVVQRRIVAREVVVEESVAAEQVGGRQEADQPLRHGQPLGRRCPDGRQGAQHVLHGIDTAAAIFAVQHHPEPTLGRQRCGQRVEAGLRIRQMMQHAAAVDVVVRPRRQPRQIEQRSGMETDVGEAAGLGARLGDGARRGREIEIYHLVMAATGSQILRQMDQSVAGTAASHQHA